MRVNKGVQMSRRTSYLNMGLRRAEREERGNERAWEICIREEEILARDFPACTLYGRCSKYSKYLILTSSQ